MTPNLLNIVDARFVSADKAIDSYDMFRRPLGLVHGNHEQFVVEVLFAEDNGGEPDLGWSPVYLTTEHTILEVIDKKVELGIVDSTDAVWIVEKLCQAAGVPHRKRLSSFQRTALPTAWREGARTSGEAIPLSWLTSINRS